MTAEPFLRRMEAEDRQQQILSHALRLFEERPYGDVSMGDIAEAAGVARPLVHHYFGTKRGVYLAALKRLTALPAMAVETMPRDSVEAAANSIIDHILSVAERHRTTWLSMLDLVGVGADAEARTIIGEADDAATVMVLKALGVEVAPEAVNLRRGVAVAYGAFGREATRQWLVEGTLTRAECAQLLTTAFMAMFLQFAGFSER